MAKYTISEQVKLFGNSDFWVITPDKKTYICDNPKSAEARRQQLIVHDFLEICTELVAEINKNYKYRENKDALTIKHSRNRLFEFLSKVHHMGILKTSTLIKYIFTYHVIELFDDFAYSDCAEIIELVKKAHVFFDVHFELELSPKN